MEILTALALIWVVTYTLSFIMNSAQASNAQKQKMREEAARKKRIDQLYGRQ